MNLEKPLTHLVPLLLILLIASECTFAQYPDRYVHYRAIPAESTLWELALESYASEKFDSAFYYIDAAEKDFNERKDPESVLFINNFKAQLLGESGQPKEALILLDSVRFVFATVADTLQSIEYAENLFLTARVSTLVNDYSNTELFLNRTISLLSASSRYPELLSIVYFTLWQLLTKMMNTELANKEIAKAIENLNTQNSQYSMATLYYIQAERLSKTQLYLKAELYIAAVKAFELSNSKSDYLYYFSLLKLAQQFSSFQSDYGTAIYYGKLAEDYVEKNRISKAKIYSFYIAMGDVYRSFRKYSEALPYFIKANEITKNVFGTKSFEYLLSNIYLGRLYHNLGDYDKASQKFYEALSVGRKGWKGRFPHEFTLYGQLSRLYLSLGNPDSALYYAQARLKYEQKIDTFSVHQIPPTPNKSNIVRYYNSLVVKIEAYKQLYQSTHDTAILTHAIAHCNHAKGLLNELNEKALEEKSGLKNSTRTKIIASYAIYFSLEKSYGKKKETFIKEAIMFSEASNANYLKYLINAKNEEVEQQPSEEMMLRKLIDQADRNHKQGKTLGLANDTELYDSTLNLKLKLANLILNERSKKEKHQIIAEEKPFASFSGIDSLQLHISDSTAILISHIDNFDDKEEEDFAEENVKSTRRIVTFYIDKNTVDFSISSLNEQEEDVFSLYLRSLKTGDNEGYSQYGPILFNLFFKPFWRAIESKSNLVIIPDEKIADIPLESLPTDTQNAPVCSRISVSHHYSLGLWENSTKSTKNNRKNSFMAIAPDFSNDNSRINSTFSNYETNELSEFDKGEMRNGNRLALLPMAKLEVLEIGDLFNQQPNMRVAIKADTVSKQQFLLDAPHYDIIHIATHGVADINDFWNSGIFFSSSPRNQSEDEGFLSLKEIYSLKTSADLVVLSACKTSVGRKVKGEGVMALPRGFILAGVPNVIASLWKVHDEKTKDLMVAFYKHLLEGNDYAESLRLAKLDCIAKGFLPMDWAGFILIGK